MRGTGSMPVRGVPYEPAAHALRFWYYTTSRRQRRVCRAEIEQVVARGGPPGVLLGRKSIENHSRTIGGIWGDLLKTNSPNRGPGICFRGRAALYYHYMTSNTSLLPSALSPPLWPPNWRRHPPLAADTHTRQARKGLKSNEALVLYAFRREFFSKKSNPANARHIHYKVVEELSKP